VLPAVLGISGQDAESKAAFSDKLGGIPFPLLVDEGDAVRKAFGVKKDLLGLLDVSSG
jgi:peroxiredoxin